MKHINTITIFLTVGAVLFTCVLMFNPAVLGITAKDTLYEKTLFDKDGITEINITISDENWSDMLENSLEKEFHLCDIAINGKTYDSVAIRTKGMTSLSFVAGSDSDRYSFKIKADKYVSGQSFDGLDEFVLNNIYQDATYMKEYLSYDMMDFIGVDTPLYSYAAVYINGEYFGLYLMIEAPEEDFLDRLYGADYGKLYKPESMSGEIGGGENEWGDRMPMIQGGNMTQTDFDSRMMPDISMAEMMGPMELMGGGGFGGMSGSSGGADLVYTNDEIDSYNQIFDNAVTNVKKSDKKRIITAIKNLNEGTDPETYVDVDEVLRYFAANTALVNLDSYVSSMKHNYYLYEKDGQISILPWDFNLAFGAYGTSGASDAVNFPIDTPVASGVSLEDRPLIGVLLENEEYKEVYHAYLENIATEFCGDSFGERIAAIDELIGDYVKTDPTAFYTYDEYKTAIQVLEEYGDLRAESILGQLNGTIPSTEEGQSENPDLLVDASGLNFSAMGDMGGSFMDGKRDGFDGHALREDGSNVSENFRPGGDRGMMNFKNMTVPEGFAVLA